MNNLPDQKTDAVACFLDGKRIARALRASAPSWSTR